ncbi:uncharacterized protein LOC114931151, partial [Nylanderia fulva]|uniref:uncharacterized protein LOC114931151 n=1 Tax=Nylanderia fulva TaxID=613905 RepID=UPI0010FB2E7B
MVVKQRIRECITCTRWREASPQPLIGNLPTSRVTPGRPFLDTGVDYAGPVPMRTSPGRGQRGRKGFIAVFICLATRAVHLEAVSDCTTDGFLAAFRRFVSRRGMCRTMHSDCGTNFVGADAQLQNMFRATSAEARHIAERVAHEGVEWRFNPPASPHFGGVWEAAVKSMKFYLRRVIGEAVLTYEEIATLLSEIEACLNSRPLQALTDDPEDLTALTPGHFLIGAPLMAVPKPSLTKIPANRLTRWKLLQQMRDHLWQRWSHEYLQGLFPRMKWTKDELNIKEGQLCLIRNESTPPCHYCDTLDDTHIRK